MINDDLTKLIAKSYLNILKEEEEKKAVEEKPAGVNDAWFDHADTFQTSKKGNPIKFETAKDAGSVDTLEGPVAYQAGHHIVTGPKGERYPVSPDKFKTLYDDNGDGSATPKKIMKSARLADHDGVLKTSWGDLTYKKGQHYIVKHGSGDFGAVQSDIFDQTYNR